MTNVNPFGVGSYRLPENGCTVPGRGPSCNIDHSLIWTCLTKSTNLGRVTVTKQKQLFTTKKQIQTVAYFGPKKNSSILNFVKKKTKTNDVKKNTK